MRTYVSPTTTIRSDLAVWRTEMGPRASGPLHSLDTDHVVVVVEGSLHVDIGDDDADAAPGDCVVLPANTPRRLTAGPRGATLITAALPGTTARAGDAAPVPVPWAH